MPRRILIFVAILFFSCNSKESKKEAVKSTAASDLKTKQTAIPIAGLDTTSSDYLIHLVNGEQPLNYYWTKKLESLRELYLLPDSTGHLSVVRDWKISDTISVIILKITGGTYDLEYLLSIKNKQVIVSAIIIGDNGDSDLNPDNPYFYTQYKISSDRRIKLFKYKVTGSEYSDDNDRIISILNYSIQDDGKIAKK